MKNIQLTVGITDQQKVSLAAEVQMQDTYDEHGKFKLQLMVTQIDDEPMLLFWDGSHTPYEAFGTEKAMQILEALITHGGEYDVFISYHFPPTDEGYGSTISLAIAPPIYQTRQLDIALLKRMLAYFVLYALVSQSKEAHS